MGSLVVWQFVLLSLLSTVEVIVIAVRLKFSWSAMLTSVAVSSVTYFSLHFRVLLSLVMPVFLVQAADQAEVRSSARARDRPNFAVWEPGDGPAGGPLAFRPALLLVALPLRQAQSTVVSQAGLVFIERPPAASPLFCGCSFLFHSCAARQFGFVHHRRSSTQNSRYRLCSTHAPYGTSSTT